VGNEAPQPRPTAFRSTRTWAKSLFAEPVPLGVLVLLGAIGYIIAFTWTGWPIFLVVSDLSEILTLSSRSAFRLVVVVVIIVSGLVAYLLGRQISHRLRRRLPKSHKAVGYIGAALLLFGLFATYRPVKDALNPLRYRSSDTQTITLVRQHLKFGVNTHAIIVTTEEKPERLWLQHGWVKDEETLWIRVTGAQIEELRSRLKERGFFSLPRYVGGPPRLSDRFFWDISMLTDSRDRHVRASITSYGMPAFVEVKEEILAYLELPPNREWTEEVPGIRDYREKRFGEQ